MTILQAIVLGVIQGITEFLPISSTAHLILFPWILGWPDPGQTFDVALHLGTLAAVVGYFGNDWWRLVVKERLLFYKILVGCFPAGVAGILLEKRLELLALPQKYPLAPVMISGSLMVIGILMWWVDRKSRKQKEEEALSFGEALLIGIGQATALFPGVSRSGASISTGLWLGLTREAAARFSFLLSAPIIAGALGWKIFHLLHQGLPQDQVLVMVAGVLSSGISGYLAIAFLLGYLRRHGVGTFCLYRILLAGFILSLWFLRRGF